MGPELLRAPNGERTPCNFDGCDRPRGGIGGYCGTHAGQIRARGAVSEIESRTKQPERCIFEGCVGRPLAHGYCSAHLRQKRVHDRMVPIVRPSLFDECTYTAAHHRCRQLWGKVQQYPCVSCGQEAADWAYDGTDPTELYDDRVFE